MQGAEGGLLEDLDPNSLADVKRHSWLISLRNSQKCRDRRQSLLDIKSRLNNISNRVKDNVLRMQVHQKWRTTMNSCFRYTWGMIEEI
jgi:hypothetical protein